MSANHKPTEESLRQDTLRALSRGTPNPAGPERPTDPGLVAAFEEAVADLTTPKGERWSCACGAAYRLPDNLTTNMRRALWLRFVADHDKPGCKVSPS